MGLIRSVTIALGTTLAITVLESAGGALGAVIVGPGDTSNDFAILGAEAGAVVGGVIGVGAAIMERRGFFKNGANSGVVTFTPGAAVLYVSWLISYGMRQQQPSVQEFEALRFFMVYFLGVGIVAPPLMCLLGCVALVANIFGCMDEPQNESNPYQSV